jgi:hypothetical protein
MRQTLEQCVQCGASSTRHPVAIVMNIKDVMTLEEDGRKRHVIELRDASGFATLPICVACHRAPKYKGHYFFRQNASMGLECAGSSDLG